MKMRKAAAFLIGMMLTAVCGVFGFPQQAFAADSEDNTAFLAEFFGLPLDEIEERCHFQMLRPGGIMKDICIGMTFDQCAAVMAELEPQREAIGKDVLRFKKAFFGILLEKLHLAGIYDFFDPGCQEAELPPNSWVERCYPFALGKEDEPGEEACVILRYHPPYPQEGEPDSYTLEYEGRSITVNRSAEELPAAIYELTVRTLYVISKYADKSYFTFAWADYVCYSPEETLTSPAEEGGTALKGDADCNGAVQIADAVLLARYLAEDPVRITAQGLRNAELDGNTAALDSGDLIALLQFIAGGGELPPASA